MITQFKNFEINKKIPEIGDYIGIYVDDLCLDCVTPDVKNFYNFINNNIGIVGYYFDHFNINKCYVDIIYYNIPENLKYIFTKSRITYEYSKTFNIKYVVAFGKIKEEVEEELKIKKYNI